MIFEVLREKYRCGCKRGLIFHKEPGILRKINSLAEWDYIKFPDKKIGETTKTVKVEKEDGTEEDVEVTVPILEEEKDFLGDPPELVPGNTILLDGQVIGIDSKDEIVLILSQTGRGSLTRVVEEVINAEYDFMNGEDYLYSMSYNDLDNEPFDIKEFDGILTIPYFDYKLFKERFVKGRGLKTLSNGDLCIRVTIGLNGLFPPTDFLLGNWDVRYKTEDYQDEDDLEVARDLVKRALRSLVKSYDRITVEEEKEKEEN